MSKRINHCYFCNSTTHNIKSCDDTRLTNFKQYCVSLRVAYQTSETFPKKKFTQIITTVALNDNINIVRSFAINMCKATKANNIKVCIDKITNYTFNLNLTKDITENLTVLLRLDELHNINNTNEIKSCIICMEEKEECQFMKFICNHDFCAHCVKNILKPQIVSISSNKTMPTCPLCRTRITTITVKDIDIGKVLM
jgi:hypothetical protein